MESSWSKCSAGKKSQVSSLEALEELKPVLTNSKYSGSSSLHLWHEAHNFTIAIYRSTSRFPDAERFGLRAQVRGPAVAIEADIAEGSGRRTSDDYGRFLDIALGSVNETECHLTIALDLGLLSPSGAEGLLKDTDEVRRMLLGLRRRLTRSAGLEVGT